MIVGVSERVIKHRVGGNSRYVQELRRNLPTEGIAYLPLSSGRLRLPGAPGVEFLIAEAAWPFSTASAGIDVIHYPADTGPVARGSVPIVTTIHGMASLHVDGVRSPLSERIWRRRTARAAAVSNHVVTVSTSSARDLVQALDVPAGRISVIPHGIDHQRFHPWHEQDQAVLRRFPLPQRFCLYLGNLDPRKNLVRLVRAFDTQQLKRVDARLVIAGRPAWDADDILEEIKRSQRVTYLGQVSEDAVAPLMRAAAGFVFPSLYEGFGFPVLEAMACGTPVVCSGRGSLEEVAGEAALVVDPLNVNCIAGAIGEIWSEPLTATELRLAGIKNADRYSWKTSARDHRRCFESVGSGR